MRLRGEILRIDGTEVYSDDVSGAIEDGPEMGRAMAAKLLAQAGPNFF
jgi:hydroxymethylbilane synthase